MQMQVIQNKLADQVVAEEKYLKEMSVIKSGNRTFQHTFHRINPRSKVNMYQARETAHSSGPASRIAQATVEGSLLKSRLITNRWLGQVSRKKRELEEKMFKMNEISMMPYSEYSIGPGKVKSAAKTISAERDYRGFNTESIRNRTSYSREVTEQNQNYGDGSNLQNSKEMDIRFHEHSLFEHANSRQAIAKAMSSSGSSINAYPNVGASISTGAVKVSNDAKKTKKWQGASVDAESRQLSNPMYEDED